MGGGNSILIEVDPGREPTPGSDRPRRRETRSGAADSGDLQSLLADALRRLAESTGSLRACAWAWRPQGEPYVIAATYRDATSPRSPDPEALATLEMLWTHDRPIDLGTEFPDRDATGALSRLAARYDMSCAMPLVSAGNERIALVLLGGPDDPPGRVRPRTLAALDAAITRLRTPAAAATALARLTELDAQVCRLDRLAVMGSLLAEVAHEIRNPLVSLKTFLHLLPDHLDDPDFQGEFRSVVLEELQRMERLLDTLLEHARPTANRVAGEATHATANLEQVLDSLQSLLKQRAAERSVELVSDIDLPSIDLPDIDHASDDIAMDEDALRQVLLNLMLNALEAAPGASRVTLRARRRDDRVEFSVEDEGEGVSEALRNRLFEPFFSTHDDRAGGLGLAITKKLIEAAGGSIHIEGGRGKGARFCVSLPRIIHPS